MNQTPSGRNFRRRHGFTLIELLTVIAIIGILASIVIATTSKVRSSAARARCVSNLRQIGMACALFVDEHKGFLPGGLDDRQSPAYDSGDGIKRLQHAEKLGPYLGLKMPATGKMFTPILACPAWLAALNAPIEETLNPDQPSLVLNIRPRMPDADGAFLTDPFGNDNNGLGKRASEIPAPSVIWAMVETDGLFRPLGWGDNLDVKGLAARPLHGNYRNAVFFDWHVGRLEGTGTVW